MSDGLRLFEVPIGLTPRKAEIARQHRGGFYAAGAQFGDQTQNYLLRLGRQNDALQRRHSHKD